MAETTLTLKIMENQDFVLVNQWCIAEGWNIGRYDGAIYHQVDPEGHFIFLKDEMPIGAISLVKHKQDFYTIGPFIVKKEWRGSGVGNIIWQRIVSRVDQTASILLYAVPEQISRYEKNGFKPYFQINRWQFVKNEQRFSVDAHVQKINFKNLPAIAYYDENIFSASREIAFEKLVTCPESSGYFIQDKQKIQGFGWIRPCIEGYRLGPLMADNVDIARKLMIALIRSIPHGQIILDSPSHDPAFSHLLKALGFRQEIKCNTCTMIKGPEPEKFIRHIGKHFAIFSLEIG